MPMMVSAYSNWASLMYFGLKGGHSPAIVVIAVDVQDLLALDTEHTGLRGVSLACSPRERPAGPGQSWELFTQKECIQSDLSSNNTTVSFERQQPTSPAQGVSSQRWLQERQRERTPHCGVGNANDMDIPVPSTMTSYSFAISSMFAVASGSGIWDMAVRVQHCLRIGGEFRG